LLRIFVVEGKTLVRWLDWRRVLVYTHRWLGIVGCALFLAWFVSGIVMMYVGMPRLEPVERNDSRPALNFAAATRSPSEAAAAADVAPQRVRVGMLGARPVYRFLARGRWTTVFADNGSPSRWLSADEMVAEVRRFAPAYASSARYDAYLTEPDQWTFGNRGLMPLHRIALGDPADTYFYLSDQTGEPVMKTTASTRRWAYAGAVLHWIYFTPFRRLDGVWAQTIIWASVAGSVMCLSGLIWGMWRYSPIARFRLKRVPSHSPYAGWMAWHHYAGLIFGLTTFTWIFSGLLSMSPWDWHPPSSPTRGQVEAVSGGPLQIDGVTVESLRGAIAALAAPRTKELDVVQFQGELFFVASGSVLAATGSHRRAAGEFDRDRILEAARAAMPGIAIEEASWLDTYDAYYYDRAGELALPVLRVRYADPQRTWLYFDPGRGAIVRKEERLTRVNRWLYHGLHSLDFPFLYYRRPLWDIVVIALSIGGIVSTVTTIVPAWRRLRRNGRRLMGIR
jgi:hypothetical protein